MSGTELMLKCFGVAYRGYMAWKFERLLQKAEAHGMTEEELCNSDQRFALFMRVGRAFEICSEREVVDYIADAMVGGIQCGDADKRPDFAQMAVSSLSGVTKVELDILCFMHAKQMYLLENYTVEGQQELKAIYREAGKELRLDLPLLNAIISGLSRTGLVSPPASGMGGVIAENTSRLTPIARELFRYVDYARRITV